ncbi:procathepsin L-like isoform X2 [Halichondria panicea]|uniref:procathepsin L-like isoform X2 n=1 Tax=Halichondria panicea TaxID=6063 RepID=UPI00312B4CF1
MSKASLLLLVLSVTLVLSAASLAPKYQFIEEWQLWKTKHTKYYDSDREELERHLVWLSNREYIQQHNVNYRAGVLGFKLALNKFADMTNSEYAAQYLTYKSWDKSSKHNAKVEIYVPPTFSSWPEFVDWRQKGAISDVKNQEDCGASYAFASIGALEGFYSLAYGKSAGLSEQNIIDCSLPEGNNACYGGNMYNTFMYIVFNDGVNTEEYYPYKGVQMPCNFSYEEIGATMSGIVIIRAGSETDLQAAVAFAGPVTVAVDASSTEFRFYSSGVFDNYRCSNYDINHAMLVIGYGRSSDGREYWRVKNSWGTAWGEDGYIMMSRNRYNQCGIATDASYPSL